MRDMRDTGMSHAIGGCKGSLASRGVQHHWCSLPPHVSNIWKHLNLNSIVPIWERAIHARGMLAIASRKTIAMVPSRIVWVYQGALEARLGLTHVSYRCRTKDCNICRAVVCNGGRATKVRRFQLVARVAHSRSACFHSGDLSRCKNLRNETHSEFRWSCMLKAPR